MNPKQMSEAEAIRSEIEMTRRRMDDTMDALGERLHGRHLVDEIIGFVRGGDEGSGARLREKITASAGTAAHAVVDTVKKNPVPLLLITAGAAWLAYSVTRNNRSESDDLESDLSDYYEPDTDYDRPIRYPGGSTEPMGDPAEAVAGSKLQQPRDTVKETLSDLTDAARDKFQSLRDRASDIGSRVQDRTREMYSQTRDRVARTADEHPIELGLGCLAVGVLIGLVLPTPAPVHRIAGPTVDRWRDQTRQAGRDAMQKGTRVVQAAMNAAKQEAKAQGLTFDRLRQAGQVSGGTAGAAAEPARIDL